MGVELDTGLGLIAVLAIAVLLVALVALKLTVLWQGTAGSASVSKLPPGPPGLPVIGNLHLLKRAQQEQGRHRALAELAGTYGDIMYLCLGRVPAVVASSAEAAQLFLKTYDAAFASRPALGVAKHMFYNAYDVIFAPYGDFWRQTRKICVVHLLAAQKVESFKGVRETEMEAVVRDLWIRSDCGISAVNIVAGIRKFAFNVMWHALAGDFFTEFLDDGFIMRLFAEISEMVALPLVGDFVPWLSYLDLPNIRRIKTVFCAFDNFAQNLLNRFKTRHLDDNDNEIPTFVGTLLKLSRMDPSVTESVIKALILDMWLGGTETISSTLEWTTALLLRHPSCLQRLQQELDKAVGRDRQIQEADVWQIKYLHCVVKESMRLYPVSPLGLPHFSTEEVTVRDFRLPKGTVLFVNYWAMNRDPAAWSNPEEFRPERFMEDDSVDLSGLSDFKTLPFGFGRRVCPGVAMAFSSVLLALAKLFHTFDWIIPQGGDVDMQEMNGNIVARKNPLMAVPKLRLNVNVA